jgi:hypothetical protein
MGKKRKSPPPTKPAMGRDSEGGRISQGNPYYEWGPVWTHTLHLDALMILMAAGDEGLSREELKVHLAAAYGRSVSYDRVKELVRDLRRGTNPRITERLHKIHYPGRGRNRSAVIATPSGEAWVRETLRRLARLNDKIIKGIAAPIAVPPRGGME